MFIEWILYGMKEKIRTFIAIPLPQSVKAALNDLCNQLGPQFPKEAVRWVQPERMHLTVRFLGDTVVSQIPNIITQLDQLELQPIRLQLNEVGCFPNRNRPRVLWVGLKEEMAQLVQLKEAVDQQLVPLNWPLETRKYNPHLTIGRIKDSGKVTKVRWGGEVEQVHFQVTAVHLIQSTLQSNGPIYKTLHSITMED